MADLKESAAIAPARSAADRVRASHAEFCLSHQLPPRKPVFGHHRLSLRDTGTVFLSGGHAAQHHAVRVLNAGRFAGVHSSFDVASDQSPRLLRLAAGALQLRIPGGHIRDRHERLAIVQFRPQQCASHHHLGNIEPVALLGGPCRAAHRQGSNPAFAGNLFQLLCGRVYRGDGGGLEPDRRRQQADNQPIG